MDHGERKLTNEQYATFAKWFKEIGLLALAAMVVQKIVSGASLADPVVVGGLLVGLVAYTIAFRLMVKAY